jgi:hypothetical protein
VLDEDTISDALAATYLDGKPQRETKIETKRPCPNCNKMLEMTDKYCPCGQMMDAEAMPPSVVAKEEIEEKLRRQTELMELMAKRMEQQDRRIAKLTSMDIEAAARKGKK